jgi:carbonic anhydrase
VTVHAWIYGLREGLLRDLGFSVRNAEGVADAYTSAISAIGDGNQAAEFA